MFTTLGWQSDAVAMAGLSQVTDRGDHIVLCTPDEPNFWWANAVIAKGALRVARMQAHFAAAFPDAAHVSLGWDRAVDAPLDEGAPPGFAWDPCDVMVWSGGRDRPTAPDGVTLRPLNGTNDWQQSMDLQGIIGREAGYDSPDHPAYLRGRSAARQRQIAAGQGAWFGAFSGPDLVAQLGVLHDGHLARFQDVETNPNWRRRGIASGLIGHALGWIAGLGLSGPRVIVADQDDGPGRLYQRLGFRVVDRQITLCRPGHRLAAPPGGPGSSA